MNYAELYFKGGISRIRNDLEGILKSGDKTNQIYSEADLRGLYKMLDKWSTEAARQIGTTRDPAKRALYIGKYTAYENAIDALSDLILAPGLTTMELRKEMRN